MDYKQNRSNFTHLPVTLSPKTPNPFAGHQLPNLNLEHYHLRPLQARDLPIWFDYLTLSEVMEHSSWVLKSPQDLQQFIQMQDWSQPQAQIKFAIADREDQLVGSIGFHTVSINNLSAEIAYDLSPAHWGKGVVSAACRSLTAWAHQDLGLMRVQACVLDTNTRSRQVLERCDFACEGLLKNYKRLRGQSRNYWIFSHIPLEPS
jgi:ribosomal-protein-alanine N-acetyltransferase